MNEKESKLDLLLKNNDNSDLKLSYSRIADFAKNGPKALLEKTPVDNQGVRMGSLIDDLLFSPELFKDKYYISDFNEPTATLGNLAKIVIENYQEIPSVDTVLQIVEQNKFWSSTKNQDLLIKNFNTPEFWGYIKDKFNSKDKIVVTSDEKIKADETIATLKTHKYSKYIFDENCEFKFQEKFEIEINGFIVRGIIDIIIIDHKNKEIRFVDLKTGGNPSSEFINSFFKYKYFIQGAIYTLAYTAIKEKYNLQDYKEMLFTFLYIGLKEQIPVSFGMSDKWQESALNGFKTTSGYSYKGLYELIDEIKYHWDNKIFDRTKEISSQNGNILLDDTFII